MTDILVVEDQSLVLGAISALLELEPGFNVCAQHTDGQSAYKWLCQRAKQGESLPDVVLTDIEMPAMTGIELTQKIQQEFSHCKVVIMTTFSRSGYIRRSMDLGVKGFILKEAPSDMLIDAIKKVLAGQRVIDPELALSALDDKDPLSDKERKALRLAGEGLKTADIAESLFLSEGTVRNYLSEAIAKLHANNRIEAARLAKQKGWL